MAIRHLSFPQCQLEAARGMLLKTAELYAEADTRKARALRRMAQDLVSLRDPDVTDLLRMRQARRLHTSRQPEHAHG